MAFRATGNTVINDVQNGTFNAVTYRNFFRQKTQAQGFNFGYVVGGTENGQTKSTIYKFPFAGETSSTTNPANLSATKAYAAGHSSSISGYSSGGLSSPFPTALAIVKFPFAAETNVSYIGGLSVFRSYINGRSSVTHGYTSGGFLFLGPLAPLNISSVIDKFPFAVDTSATSVGNLSVAKAYVGAQSSLTHGYNSGGYVDTTTYTLVVERFPFAVDTNATNVGNLSSVARIGIIGQSSAEHGYSSGGAQYLPTGASAMNIIDRFPFAVSTTNATNVGTLPSIRYIASGYSTTTHGYICGGYQSTEQNMMERFPFAVALTNAVDVGDLSNIRALSSDSQY